VRPFSRTEAVASSKIEGTITTPSELFALELTADLTSASKDTIEVNNYLKALTHGLRRVKDLPVSRRLMCELHAILLQGVTPERGARFPPGEFKTDQNWIGGGTIIQNARFVPPPPAEAMVALDELERFIHREPEPLPLLVKLALVHYQFETIHPFPDGNGRVGRLLIPLMLCELGAMSQPLLYLSAFFEKNYDKYIDLLFEVSRSGGWSQWIDFFLEGVEVTARSAIRKAQALQDLHRQYMQKVQTARSSSLLGKLVDSLFEVPAINIPIAQHELRTSYNSAKKNLQKLVDLKILAPDPKGGRPLWYYSWEIMDAVSNEPVA
jgi:Fic family protein